MSVTSYKSAVIEGELLSGLSWDIRQRRLRRFDPWGEQLSGTLYWGVMTAWWMMGA